jgi:hypothetical protein
MIFMDKSTLSQYGWVVICLIVLAIMIALASPFGNFIKESILGIITSFNQEIISSLDINSSNPDYEDLLKLLELLQNVQLPF